MNREKMTQITLNIPDNELSFFMQLIEKFNYETVVNDVTVSEEMKIVLDERRVSSFSRSRATGCRRIGSNCQKSCHRSSHQGHSTGSQKGNHRKERASQSLPRYNQYNCTFFTKGQFEKLPTDRTKLARFLEGISVGWCIG